MHKWILIFCLPLASVAETSLCSKRIANLIQKPPKMMGFLQTLRDAFARENTIPEQISVEAAIQANHTARSLDPILVERPYKPNRPIPTKGLDEANHMIQLAERLRNSQIDSYTTHIPEFADDIPKHISWITEGIEKSGEKKEARLKILDDLEKEALEKAKNKQVTYAWWLSWNDRLTKLASSVKVFKNTHIASLYTVPIFPDMIIIPTINDFGIQAFNRSLSQRVFPLGVVNQLTYADGILMTPHDFFIHDTNHVSNITRNLKHTSLFKIENSFNINLYQELQKLDLSLEQQEMIDIIYFSIFHEEIMHIHLVQDWQESKDLIIFEIKYGYIIDRFQKKGDLRELLPTSVNADSKEEVEAYLNESKQLFEQLSHRILKSTTHTQ